MLSQICFEKLKGTVMSKEVNEEVELKKVEISENGEEQLSKKVLKAKKKQEKKEKKKSEKMAKFEAKAKSGISSFFADFKKFIAKGNIIDLAVAVVIGAAFNKIVSSLVNDIIMPLISLATGGASVADWKWVIKEAVYDASGNLVTAETALRYGIFIQSMIDFLIIALTIFIVLRIIVDSQRGMLGLGKKLKKLRKEKQKGEVVEEVKETPQVAPVKIESEEDVLKDIRELLKAQIGQSAIQNTNIDTSKK